MTTMLAASAQFASRYNDALELNRSGYALDAVRVLKELERTGLHRPAVVGMLGTILLYDLDNTEEALPYLRLSVSLSPRSEVSSLALFHALMRKGESIHALGEAQRFLGVRRSDEYKRLLAKVEQAPSVSNRRPRVSCFLLVDTSAAMASLCSNLCRGLGQFTAWVKAHPLVREQLDLVLVTFGGHVRYATNLASVIGFSAPPDAELAARPLAAAVQYAAAALEKQIEAYATKGLAHRNPWLIAITSGASEGEPPAAITDAIQRLGKARARCNVNIYPVMVGASNHQAELLPFETAPCHLRDNDFPALFRWLADGLTWATAAPFIPPHPTPAR